jgi:hypothetical protein
VSVVELTDGWVLWTCNHPGCTEQARFRPSFRGPVPKGWHEDVTVTTERWHRGDRPPRHYCPAHAMSGAIG